MRRAALVVLTLIAAGCSEGADDGELQQLAAEGEHFIEGDEPMLPTSLGFATVDCATPESAEVGTRFACEATTTDGYAWRFVMEVGDERVRMVDVAPIAGA